MVDLTETTETAEIAMCRNKGLPLEKRSIEGIPVGITSEESFESACYLCPGKGYSCYNPSNK